VPSVVLIETSIWLIELNITPSVGMLIAKPHAASEVVVFVPKSGATVDWSQTRSCSSVAEVCSCLDVLYLRNASSHWGRHHASDGGWEIRDMKVHTVHISARYRPFSVCCSEVVLRASPDVCIRLVMMFN
jgi:hypothetical protein